MKRILIAILLLCLLVTQACGQIEVYIDRAIKSMPKEGTGEYTAPTQEEIKVWKDAVFFLLDGETGMAQDDAKRIGCSLSVMEEGEETYYILDGNLWGTYVFSKNACRSNLVIQSPHPLHDKNTGKQGIFIFKELDARAFCMTGAHRYNNEPSSNVTAFDVSIFQATTEVLKEEIPSSVFVQLHGYAKKEGDPDAIISNSTDDTPEKDYARMLKKELLEEDPSLELKMPHVDWKINRLRGFENTQAAYINKKDHGDFIHFEQEYSKLRESKEDWQNVADALGDVFPCSADTTSIQVEDLQGNMILNLILQGKYIIKINGKE